MIKFENNFAQHLISGTKVLGKIGKVFRQNMCWVLNFVFKFPRLNSKI